MKFLTVDELSDHFRADGEDDGNLESYGESAEEIVVAALNRQIFKDDADRTAQLAGLAAARTAAKAAYDAAVDAAADVEDDELKAAMLDDALQEYDRQRIAFEATLNGRVINAGIKGAMLLMATHLWQNRGAVVAGQGAAGVELPLGVKYIVGKFRYWGRIV